jgi:hypothetical protein
MRGSLLNTCQIPTKIADYSDWVRWLVSYYSEQTTTERDGVRIPVEVREFSCLQIVHTASGAHPVSFSTGTGLPSPGAQSDWGLNLTT